MIKTIGFLPRRPDLSRDAFRTYYEDRHAPLAIGLFPFTRYRRNHLADAKDDPGFDCVSEFWVPSVEEIGALMMGPAGETMKVDERNFMDQPRISAAVAEETLAGPDGAASLILLQRTGGDVAALAAICASVGAGLDLLVPFDTRPLPCDAVVIVPVDADLPSTPSGWRMIGRHDLIRAETDPSELGAA